MVYKRSFLKYIRGCKKSWLRKHVRLKKKRRLKWKRQGRWNYRQMCINPRAKSVKVCFGKPLPGKRTQRSK